MSAITVVICLPLLRLRGSRILLAALAGVWALLVGLSRVALVVHWPTDVIGAWLFVLSVVPAVWLLLSRIFCAEGRDGAFVDQTVLAGTRSRCARQAVFSYSMTGAEHGRVALPGALPRRAEYCPRNRVTIYRRR
jgi:hypothetical protein